MGSQTETEDIISVLAYIKFELNDIVATCSMIDTVKERVILLSTFIDSKVSVFKLFQEEMSSPNIYRPEQILLTVKEEVLDDGYNDDTMEARLPGTFEQNENNSGQNEATFGRIEFNSNGNGETFGQNEYNSSLNNETFRQNQNNTTGSQNEETFEQNENNSSQNEDAMEVPDTKHGIQIIHVGSLATDIDTPVTSVNKDTMFSGDATDRNRKKGVKGPKKKKTMENVCMYCGKKFKQKRNLVTHEKEHNGRLPFSCCGTGFSSKRGLLRHNCSVHGATKSFICMTCSKAFTTKSDLDRHVLRHTEMSFCCNVCGHKTPTRHELTQHMNTHTDKNNYVCSTCSESFKHASSLHRHNKKTHKDK